MSRYYVAKRDIKGRWNAPIKEKLEDNASMKKEELDILQNEFVFCRLSGSTGKITAVSMGDKHYFRGKGKTQCPNTERQQAHHKVTARGVAAWQSLAMDKQKRC